MNIRHLTMAALAAAALSPVPALADRPANLAGTTWTVQINRDSEQLVIQTQGGPGAPGAATCRVINGTLGIAPVRGWYCPGSGRVHFEHRNIDSKLTMRSFTGSVSEEVVGQPLYMAGTVMVNNSVFDDLGEYNFSAVR